ncbi:MAG: tetratricopeptide repeat protein [Phycisphaerae bacterium]|nr:tetratricopeptide repeat protein [Phycisphaerae bacterium]
MATIKPSWQRTVFTCALLLIWCFIVTGSVITWIDPPWLRELSHPGRLAEAGTHSASGVQRMRDRNFEGAIVAFERALSVHDEPQTRVHLAIAHAHAGRPELGLRMLQEELQKDPPRFLRGVILFNIAELLFKQPVRRGEAIDYYRESLECGAEPDKVHRRLGQILYEQGKLREAAVELQKSVQAQLDPAQGYRNMLQRGLEGQNVVPADEIEAQAAAGITAEDMARYDLKVITAYQWYNNTDLADTFNMLGTVHALLGEFAEARAAFTDAQRIWPDNPQLARNIQMLDQAERQARTSRQAPQPPQP